MFMGNRKVPEGLQNGGLLFGWPIYRLQTDRDLHLSNRELKTLFKRRKISQELD